MNKFILIAIVLALVAICKADISTFSYSAVSTSNQDYQRAVTMGTINTLGVSGSKYESISRQKTTNGREVNAIHGSCYQFLFTSPTSVFAYWNRGVEVNNNGNATDFNVDTTSGFTGTSYFALQEVDASGSVVKTVHFRGINFDVTNSSGAGHVKWSVMRGVSVLHSLTVELTFILTEGEADIVVAGAQTKRINSKELETIVSIDASSYNYASPNNRLRLVTYVLAGSFSRSTSGSGMNRRNIITSNGVNVYFEGSAVVSGSRQDVTVNVEAESDTSVLRNGQVIRQWEKRFSGQKSLNRVTIDFPADAKIIVYDPTTSVPSSAASLCFSLVVALGCVISFIIF